MKRVTKSTLQKRSVETNFAETSTMRVEPDMRMMREYQSKLDFTRGSQQLVNKAAVKGF